MSMSAMNVAPVARRVRAYKQSGNGREWGDHAFAEFLETKSMLGWGAAEAAE